MTNTPKAIVFDIGGVLIDVDLNLCPQIWAEASGRDAESICEIFWGDSDYQPLERGEITLDDYRQSMTSRLGFDISPEDFYRGWTGVYRGEVEGMGQLVAKVAKKLRTVCLSNTNAAHVETFTVQFAHLFEPMEKHFYSNEMSLRKPDRRIYTPVIDYLALKPDEIIFVDDKPANIDAASELGMRAVLFDSASQLSAQLSQMGIEL